MKTRGNTWLRWLTVVIAIHLMIGSSSVAAVQRTTFGIAKLSCVSCLGVIEADLQAMPGALSMDADLERHLVIVDHQDSLAAADLAAALDSIGYPASILSTVQEPDEPAAGSGGENGVGNRSPVGEERPWAPRQGDEVTSVFMVENLSCASCLDTIGSKLRGMPGVVGVDADYSGGLVLVEHGRQLAGAMIAKLITAAGHPAHYVGTGKKGAREAVIAERAASAAPAGCDSRSCGASARDWKLLYRRFFAGKGR